MPTATSLSILVIDDEPDIVRVVANHLKARGHDVMTAESGIEGIAFVKDGGVDIVITDVKMPGMDGYEVLSEVRSLSPTTEVIMVTGFGDVDMAVRAMKEGAFDFFTKPMKLQELVASLQRTERFHALRQENVRYRGRLDRIEAQERSGLAALIGESEGMRKALEQIGQVAAADETTVLVTGETGTGKELVARAIHTESARAGGPFIAVDCSSIPESLVEAEFYGHEKGAFTDARESRAGYFELADGGTLFLDEIGDMDTGMQTRLLRTLEERRVRRVGGAKEIPVNVRVVSATHRDLAVAVEEGGFRRDLFYRVNTFTIAVPPLRERREDIRQLAEAFLSRYAREIRKPVTGFADGAILKLEGHSFPGNVRELRNIIERAVIVGKGDRISAGDIELLEAHPSTDAPDVAPSEEDLSLDGAEQRLIREALRRSGGNQVQASKLLGISRTALRRRMERHGISVGDP